MEYKDIASLGKKINQNVAKVMIGREKTVDIVLAALIAGGHVLLEDMPGTGKTVLAKSMAKSMALSFSRIQFTPDLLPSDVTGISVYQPKEGNFEFKPGPVFTNVLLADEINRATPRTQSALLECMEEKQVTEGGVSSKLSAPFMVIATQNPVEIQGTFPLPEAQMDRFLMQISMESLDVSKELAMIRRFLADEPLSNLGAICTKEELKELQEECCKVYVHEELLEYIVKIVHATRSHSKVDNGVSPRGTLALVRAAQGYAMVQGRDYVVPEDVKAVAVPVLAHRLSMMVAADGKRGAGKIIDEILYSVEVPTEEWKKR